MIRVLIVDDSAVARLFIQEALCAAPDIDVVGTALDPFFARNKIKKLQPDVVTLDLTMPRMGGLDFLRRLMAYKPIPVVIISSLSMDGAPETIEALALGAFDVICKPTGDDAAGLRAISKELVEKVRAAGAANIAGLRRAPRLRGSPRPSPGPRPSPNPRLGRAPVICIGASTGGTVAIEHIVTRLDPQAPPVLVVLHLPAFITAAYARRLDRLCAVRVLEAADGLRLDPGTVAIAPGDRHILLERDRSGYWVRTTQDPAVNWHRPSVDVLFRSAANTAGAKAMGILLTGMGGDGARGLLEMLRAGAYTVAQDEVSSVVWGMPRVAIEMGAASGVLSLDEIPLAIDAFFKDSNEQSAR